MGRECDEYMENETKNKCLTTDEEDWCWYCGVLCGKLGIGQMGLDSKGKLSIIGNPESSTSNMFFLESNW